MLLRVVLFALLLSSIAVAGCSGGGSSGTANGGASPPQALVLGDLQGPLADNLHAALTLESPLSLSSAGEGLPVLVGAGGLNGENLPFLAATWRSGQPVALVAPTAGDIAALRGALGLGASPVDGLATPDLYALDRNKLGESYEVAVLPPFATSAPGTDEITGENFSEVLPLTLDDPDDETEQQGRTDAFALWVEEDSTRDADLLSFRGADLKSQATRSEFRTIHTFRRNIHTVDLTFWSVHEVTRGEYWFICELGGILAASPAMEANDEYDRGWFTDRYEFNVGIPVTDGSVALGSGDAQPSPQTTEKQANVSTSVSFSLSGKIAFNGKVSDKTEIGGNTEVASQVSWSNSYSYPVKDVTVLNNSGSQVNANAGWIFEMARPYYDKVSISFLGCVFNPKVYDAPDASRGTYQPKMTWVWKVNPSVRTQHPNVLPVNLDFRTRIGRIQRMPDCKFSDKTVPSEVFSRTVFVPWPPLTAP